MPRAIKSSFTLDRSDDHDDCRLPERELLRLRVQLRVERRRSIQRLTNDGASRRGTRTT